MAPSCPTNDPTKPAKQLWAAVCPGEDWPSDWRVEWSDALGLSLGDGRFLLGRTLFRERLIRLLYPFDCHRDPVETLLHEFAHVRVGRPGHGKEFTRIKNELRIRARQSVAWRAWRKEFKRIENEVRAQLGFEPRRSRRQRSRRTQRNYVKRIWGAIPLPASSLFIERWPRLALPAPSAHPVAEMYEATPRIPAPSLRDAGSEAG